MPRTGKALTGYSLVPKSVEVLLVTCNRLECRGINTCLCSAYV